MTRDDFDHLVSQLKKGDNSVLAALQSYQPDCIGLVRNKSGQTCSFDEAYDIFIDSVLDFRKNVLKGKVEYGNVKAYLQRMCYNKWLAFSRKKARIQQKEEQVKRKLYVVGSDSEPEEKAENDKEKKLGMIKKAMQILSDKCRQMLQLAIVEGCKMQEIARIMELANANVAKTTKSRCYKKLLSEIRQMEA